MNCRLCSGETTVFLKLGKTALPEEFREKKDLKTPITMYPLSLASCRTCGHIQLGSIIDPDVIYKQNYWYDFSVTETGKKHWKNLAQDLYKKHALHSSDLVVDIGSNTGALLRIFQDLGVKVVGLDPAPALAAIAEKNNIPTIVDYFTQKAARTLYKKYGRAKIVACTNVFDHVESLTEWVQALHIILDPDGICVIEIPYFPYFITHLSHVVYHQQIDYMRLKPLLPFFEKNNLFVMEAEGVAFHGESLRLYISKHRPVSYSKNILSMLKKEQQIFSDQTTLLSKFAKTIHTQKDTLKQLLLKLKKHHKRIAAAGASAKGITVLNYCSIGPDIIDYITEKSDLKTGKYTPSGIPIKTDDAVRHDQPDYILILAWNFKEEIMKNLQGFNGRFIIPVPRPKIIEHV